MLSTDIIKKTAIKFNLKEEDVIRIFKSFWSSIREIAEDQKFYEDDFKIVEGKKYNFRIPSIGMFKFNTRTMRYFNWKLNIGKILYTEDKED